MPARSNNANGDYLDSAADRSYMGQPAHAGRLLHSIDRGGCRYAWYNAKAERQRAAAYDVAGPCELRHPCAVCCRTGGLARHRRDQ